MKSAPVVEIVFPQVRCQRTNPRVGPEGDSAVGVTTTARCFKPSVGAACTVALYRALWTGLNANALYSIGIVVSSEVGEKSPDGEVIILAIGLPVDAFGFENTQALHMYLPFF